jgi:hypothetical protein
MSWPTALVGGSLFAAPRVFAYAMACPQPPAKKCQIELNFASKLV